MDDDLNDLAFVKLRMVQWITALAPDIKVTENDSVYSLVQTLGALIGDLKK